MSEQRKIWERKKVAYIRHRYTNYDDWAYDDKGKQSDDRKELNREIWNIVRRGASLKDLEKRYHRKYNSKKDILAIFKDNFKKNLDIMRNINIYIMMGKSSFKKFCKITYLNEKQFMYKRLEKYFYSKL